MSIPKIDICILNYNGSNDTLKCIESIFSHEKNLDYRILIYDNDSREDQKQTLLNGLEKSPFSYKAMDVGDQKPNEVGYSLSAEVTVFFGDNNLGFAKGNNWLLEFGLRGNADYFILLNNDTELIEQSITKLLNAVETCKSQCDYASTDIHYYDEPSRSWNAGGSIFFGTRHYYVNRDVELFLVRKDTFPKVDYITGCFLLLPRETILKMGLLSETFFFGEEDYEFALRAKSKGMTGRVLMNTHILHKVGASVGRGNKEADLSRSFLHRLNRFVDMKHYYSKTYWHFWRYVSCIYFSRELFGIYGLSFSEVRAYLQNLMLASNVLEGVGKGIFILLSGKPKKTYLTPFSADFIWQLQQSDEAQ